ncbi:uncharacterized protein [Drosophila suzukii]|uniref:TIL domain-containing protein n=1 Tax=Drosophila suzukii TaxID=28584 RepID=A0AB39ZN97_DROSZ
MLDRQITLRLLQLFLLMKGSFRGSSEGFPLNSPCGEHEELACMPCTQPKCSYPYVDEPLCIFFKICHLGCGCKFGYIRDDLSNQCIPNYECKIPVRQLNVPIL